MAEPAKVIEFKLPKRPKIIEKQAPPDQRKFAVVPMRAALDTELHGFSVKVLVLLCSYANRAGITWVGQQRIAEHLGVAKQQVARAMKQLRERGHIEVMSKGFRGERANTTRVIYDTEIKAEDAIAITSGQEDTRPPHQIKKETAQATEPEFTEEQMAANRKRLKELLGGLATRDGFHYNKPEKIGDIVARKPKAKPTPKTPLIDNTIDNTGVVQTRKNIGLREVIGLYEDITKHKKTYVTTSEVDLKFAEVLCQVGCKPDRFEAACRALKAPTRLAEVCEALIG